MEFLFLIDSLINCTHIVHCVTIGIIMIAFMLKAHIVHPGSIAKLAYLMTFRSLILLFTFTIYSAFQVPTCPYAFVVVLPVILCSIY